MEKSDAEKSRLNQIKEKIQKWKEEGYKVDDVGKAVESYERQTSNLKKSIVGFGIICVVVIILLSVWNSATLEPSNSVISFSELEFTPTIQMLPDEDDDRLFTIYTDADAYWDNLTIMSTEDVKIYINGEVGATLGYNLTANTYYRINSSVISNPHVLINGSDFIDIGSITGNLSDVTITIIHDDTNTTLGTYTFSSISMKL